MCCRYTAHIIWVTLKIDQIDQITRVSLNPLNHHSPVMSEKVR